MREKLMERLRLLTIGKRILDVQLLTAYPYGVALSLEGRHGSQDHLTICASAQGALHVFENGKQIIGIRSDGTATPGIDPP